MKPLEAGDTVDRYVVEGVLGEGGMAVVYLVRHSTLGTEHALKVLSISNREVAKRMVSEGRVQATLNHDNIVQVTDILDINGSPGLLMEFIRGPSLEEWLWRYEPTVEEAIAIFRGIVAGVGHAHVKGLIHRDLKPANVMLAVGGGRMVPKVTDFGLAKDVQSDTTKTRAGATFGTPGFMAPEQIRDASNVDRRADMWSLGCIFYQLVCGKAPFAGDDIITLLNAVSTGTYTPPHEVKPELTDQSFEVIDALLQVNPRLRLANCSEAMGYLDGSIPEMPDDIGPDIGELPDPQPAATTAATFILEEGESFEVAMELVEEAATKLTRHSLTSADGGWTAQKLGGEVEAFEDDTGSIQAVVRKTWPVWLLGLGGFGGLTALVTLGLLIAAWVVYSNPSSPPEEPVAALEPKPAAPEPRAAQPDPKPSDPAPSEEPEPTEPEPVEPPPAAPDPVPAPAQPPPKPASNKPSQIPGVDGQIFRTDGEPPSTLLLKASAPIEGYEKTNFYPGEFVPLGNFTIIANLEGQAQSYGDVVVGSHRKLVVKCAMRTCKQAK